MGVLIADVRSLEVYGRRRISRLFFRNVLFGLDDLLSCLIFGQTEMLKLGLEDMI